ncbi:unnamed protein product [Lactuca saligna]|uniref:Uncharacterized protein n=1 Tax=Lactuca saligna TaxID=75948 RepID=A0AA35ZVG1_LACSI|nr:unnamed protein product [Lactuca saligna]
MLKTLCLNGNPIDSFDSFPDCVRTLTRLEVLSVGECSMLKSVLCPPRTIKRLFTQQCLSLIKITFREEISTPPLVFYQDSMSLTKVQGIIKIQAIAEIDDKILCSLGWKILKPVKDHKVKIWDSYMWSRVKKLPVHMYYEFGIFSICYPGKVVPDWLAHRRNGTRMDYDYDIVWLSHWMFRNNEIENGDEVSVTIVEEEDDGGVMIKECAAGLVYNDRDNEEDPLSYYKLWKHIIDGDLSAFRLTSGDYFLTHDRFYNPPHRFKDLFEHKTTHNLVGYTPQYKGNEEEEERERRRARWWQIDRKEEGKKV